MLVFCFNLRLARPQGTRAAGPVFTHPLADDLRSVAGHVPPDGAAPRASSELAHAAVSRGWTLSGMRQPTAISARRSS